MNVFPRLLVVSFAALALSTLGCTTEAVDDAADTEGAASGKQGAAEPACSKSVAVTITNEGVTAPAICPIPGKPLTIAVTNRRTSGPFDLDLGVRIRGGEGNEPFDLSTLKIGSAPGVTPSGLRLLAASADYTFSYAFPRMDRGRTITATFTLAEGARAERVDVVATTLKGKGDVCSTDDTCYGGRCTTTPVEAYCAR